MLVAYTNAKLLTNTDTLTSWLEGPTGGVGQVQDWNNLKGEKSLSSQDVSQRLVISYVLDLPFGHGRRYAAGFSGVADKVVSGWGIDGVTTFQRGFPLKITWAGTATPLEAANLPIQRSGLPESGTLISRYSRKRQLPRGLTSSSARSSSICSTILIFHPREPASMALPRAMDLVKSLQPCRAASLRRNV
jgi:hypothetical protein